MSERVRERERERERAGKERAGKEKAIEVYIEIFAALLYPTHETSQIKEKFIS